MDSGNSGSMQSSSGGDEEYDSNRADSIPTNFFSNPSSNYHHHHPISTPPSSLFNNNPPSNYILDAFSQSQANPNSLLNLDVVWSRGLQLDHPNYDTTLVGNLTAPSSITTPTSSAQQSVLIGSQGGHQGGRGQGAYQYPTSSSPMLRPVHENGSGIVKNNPKKRTRASRRAPTTVLTTDTSNFRAMVQEFTGIPAPPFSAVSSYSRRLDLFGTGAAAAAAMRAGGTGHSEPSLGSSSFLYPLRPSAQKIHQFTPSLVSSSPLFLNSSIVDTSTTTTTTNNTNLNSNPGKYQQADDQDILMNMQNDQMLTFQSLMQQQQQQHPPSNFPTQLKYSLADEAAVFGTKSTQGPSQLEELRMSHGNVNAANANINVHTSWRDGGAGSNNNHSHEKGLEMINNVSSRGGEGTVDSWICPSD